MGSTTLCSTRRSCWINSVRGNDPERLIHGTSFCAFDSATALDMPGGTRTKTRCHNWGVARAIDCHDEDTAQSGSGFFHIGSTTFCSSMAKERMKIVTRISKGRVSICGWIRALGALYCAVRSDCMVCKGDGGVAAVIGVE
jgi:hypothetical protein